jgi:predicted RNase H-like nuclease
VDGCRAGWVVARPDSVVVVPRLLIDRTAITGIDMPIGLPDSRPRACDRAARALLGPRRSSVFPAPARACLGASDYADALDRSRLALGVGLSQQAYHLLPKITEIDDQIGPHDDHCVVEVHPECSFHLLNGRLALPPKSTPAGSALRAALLEAEFGALPPVPRGAAIDDLHDAYAVLWSTLRFAAGKHIELGDGTCDGRGLPMRIVC